MPGDGDILPLGEGKGAVKDLAVQREPEFFVDARLALQQLPSVAAGVEHELQLLFVVFAACGSVLSVDHAAEGVDPPRRGALGQQALQRIERIALTGRAHEGELLIAEMIRHLNGHFRVVIFQMNVTVDDAHEAASSA